MIWLAAAAVVVTAVVGSGGDCAPVSFTMRTPDGQIARSPIRLDAGYTGTASLVADDVPVEPLARYRFAARIYRIRGDRSYNLALEWLDSNKAHLGYENSWMGLLFGNEWNEHYAEAISPPNARFARLLVEVPAPGACLLSQPTITRLPASEPRLAVDLIAGLDSLAVRVENRAEAAASDIALRVRLPEGLSSSDRLTADLGDLAFGQSKRIDFELHGTPRDPSAPIVCEISASTRNAPYKQTHQTLPFVSQAVSKPCLTADLATPQLPQMDIRLGAYYFPVMLDWDRGGWGVRKVDDLTPVLGYYNEASPEVADWHICWAVTHGISYFVFDWYYNQGFSYLNDALEKGFLKSRFSQSLQFCVDWCNEGQASEYKPVDFSTPSLLDFIQTLCDRYFTYPNYLRVDGKPVVLIHQPGRIAAAHGSWAGCKLALDAMRDRARSLGHPGVYFVAVHTNSPYIPDYQLGGFDCVTAYAYGFRDVAWDTATRSLPFESLMPRHQECFGTARDEAHKRKLDYIPSAWVGWDDRARSNEGAVRTEGNTPAAFRRMIEMLPEYVEPDSRLALFESWNEWGEGGQAEPDEVLGFGRLSAIRDVLTTHPGPYEVSVPTAAEKKRVESHLSYQQVNDIYYTRYSRQLNLDKGLNLKFGSQLDLWLRPVSGLVQTAPMNGYLHLESASNDPVLITPPALGIRAGRSSTATVRMRSTAGTEAQLFWTTEPGKWSEQNSIRFKIASDGEFHEHTLDLGKHPNWKGRIYQLRLDPSNAPCEITIDRFVLAP